MPDDGKQAQDAIEKDLRGYRALNQVNKNPDFDVFFDLLLKTCSDKMVWAFTGDNIKSYDDFCKVRGEVVSYLFPIQEVRSASSMAKHLQDQLNEYYKNPNN